MPGEQTTDQLAKLTDELRAAWRQDRDDIRTVLDALNFEASAGGHYVAAMRPALASAALAAWRRLERIRAAEALTDPCRAPVPEARTGVLGYLLVSSEDVAGALNRNDPSAILRNAVRPGAGCTAGDIGEARDIAAVLAQRWASLGGIPDDVVIVELREVERVPSAVK